MENKKLVFEDFWLFIRSLSCMGSSGRLVVRISPKLRPNPRKPIPLEGIYTQHLIVVNFADLLSKFKTLVFDLAWPI